MEGALSTDGPILVVDDDQKIVQLVRAYLEREGFPVVTAADGRAALASIRERPPRLIVLDLMLPEIDGMTVARRVREDSDIPILMLSARGAVADRIQGLTEGAAIPLTTAELRLLVALTESAGRVLSRDALLDALHGQGASEAVDRTVDVYIGRLREKLGDDPEQPRYIATVRGAGYRAVTPR